jgi:hypothetical protein
LYRPKNNIDDLSGCSTALETLLLWSTFSLTVEKRFLDCVHNISRYANEVAGAGGFTAAAKRLERATSRISYAVDTLEQVLGLSPFDRGTTRELKLMLHGEAVVSEALPSGG